MKWAKPFFHKPEERGRAVINIMKCYHANPTVSGLYEDDLETVHSQYQNVARFCDATTT